jgi:hypothetical protein
MLERSFSLDALNIESCVNWLMLWSNPYSTQIAVLLQDSDPVVAVIRDGTEEGKKVSRNNGQKWAAVFRRIADTFEPTKDVSGSAESTELVNRQWIFADATLSHAYGYHFVWDSRFPYWHQPDHLLQLRRKHLLCGLSFEDVTEICHWLRLRENYVETRIYKCAKKCELSKISWFGAYRILAVQLSTGNYNLWKLESDMYEDNFVSIILDQACVHCMGTSSYKILK